MHLPRLSLFACLLSVYFGSSATCADEARTQWKYPMARRGDYVDNYHGVEVPDYYRWLEDVDSEETGEWVAAQNELTNAYLESIPEREEIRARLTELWDYPAYGLPIHRGGKYFYEFNPGLLDQDVLYVADALDAEPRVLLDPNHLSEDGTVALSGSVVSKDGRYLAYGVAASGSDWNTWKVRDVADGQDLDDVLEWVKFSSASWTPDGEGFYYSRYDAPVEGEEYTQANYYHKLYYHRIGTPQSEDELVYHRDDQPEWGFGADVSEDGRWLVISVWKGANAENQLFVKNLADPDSEVVELITGFDAEYVFLAADADQLLVRTDLDADRGRIVAIDPTEPARENWETLVPEADDAMVSASFVGGRLIATYLHHAASAVTVFDRDGAFVRQVELPGLGVASGFGGRGDDPETFYRFTSFTQPGDLYRYNVETGEQSLWKRAAPDFDSDSYETTQVFFESTDGARVPMFITQRKGAKLTGEAPVLLYAYGGFNIPVTPTYRTATAAWLEMGGIYAQANLRGGGEYGRAWHEAGMLDQKQHVFDDFIGAAEWLIDNGYTRSGKIGISGRSNGGLLVGACMVQRPDLFGACLPGVGVMDMLRFHQFTIGWAWVGEYGSSDDPEQFETLYAYSPLHNLKPETPYPATMVTTADHDDRVVPGHSFKFAAALQAATSGERPALIRIETKAGHGAGTPTSKQIDQAADELAFLVHELGVAPPKD